MPCGLRSSEMRVVIFIFSQTCMLFKSMCCNPYFTNFFFFPLSPPVTLSSPRMDTRTGSFPLHGSVTLWQFLVKLSFCREFWYGKQKTGRLEVEKAWQCDWKQPSKQTIPRGQEILFPLLAFSVIYHMTLDKSFPLCNPDLGNGITGILHLLFIPSHVPESMCDSMLVSTFLWGFIEIMVVKVFWES